MAKRPPITDEQGDKIASYREAGRSISWIARRLDLSQGTVAWRCLKHGIEAPNAKVPPAYSGPAIVVRNGHVVRRFTPEEDALLLQLEAAGETTAAIAKQLNRRHNTVTGRLATLARRAERMAAIGDTDQRKPNP